MRAKLEQLNKTAETQSFSCYEIVLPSFDFYWHYHPEYELTYIANGKGKRLVGDSYEQFTEGDFVLMGPNIPHTWVSDEERKQKSIAIVIQFTASFVEPLLAYAEFADIKKLLQKSNSGLHFKCRKNCAAIELMMKMKSLQGIHAITTLIQLLHTLSGVKTKPLASATFIPAKGEQNEKRINKVFLYVQKGFTGQLTLLQAAKTIHLSVSAFCKFFKKVSGKTFSDYVNETRIGQVCTLLIETDKPISTIAFECGFENLAYFNRVFLKKKKMRPVEFRRGVLISNVSF